MRKIILYILIFLTVFPSVSCRKKTSINVTVFNYPLNETVPDATVVLIERYQSGRGTSSCKEVATAVTDSNGECTFNKEKLRNGQKYTYFFGITRAYGVAGFYACEGKTSGFLEKGKTANVTLGASVIDGNLIVKQNNLLNPSQPNDSISISIVSGTYYLPEHTIPSGGGGVLNTYAFYGMNGFPFPPVLISDVIKTACGTKIIKVRKRKMGIVTASSDTIKIYPNETKTIVLNW